MLGPGQPTPRADLERENLAEEPVGKSAVQLSWQVPGPWQQRIVVVLAVRQHRGLIARQQGDADLRRRVDGERVVVLTAVDRLGTLADLHDEAVGEYL